MHDRLPALGCIIALLVAVPPLWAQDCTCRGPLQDHYASGNASHLLWSFETYVDTLPTPFLDPIICYHKKIENNSSIQVRNVRWEAGSFFPPPLPAHSISAECPTLPGVLNLGTTSGPLYYGVSSRSYPTIVRQPKAGWKASFFSPPRTHEMQLAQAGSPIDELHALSAIKYPELRSEFSNSIFRIVITSRIEVQKSTMQQIITSIDNNGDNVINVNSDMAELKYLIPGHSSTKHISYYFIDEPIKISSG